MSESVRSTWIYSMHRCAGVHNAMCSLTNNRHLGNQNHVDLRPSRIARDIEDMNKLSNWLDEHDPFDESTPVLRNLANGKIADESLKIDCDQVEQVGENQ